MKKLCIFLAILTAISASLLAFAGCGASATPTPDSTPSATAPATQAQPTVTPDPPAEKGYDGSEVTIRFYHTMGQPLQEILNQYIEEFNTYYPNIHIDHSQVGGYDDVRNQIKTEITVGDQPNLAYCYPDHVALYNDADAVQKLDSLIGSKAEVTRADGSKEIMGLTEEQLADYVETYWEEGKVYGDGLTYTVPFSKSTEFLFYNKTFFEQNHLTVPATWDEMYALCKKIKEINPNCIPLGVDSEANWFITMCEQSGSTYTSASSPHFLFNNETNRAFVKEFNKWYSEGLVTTQGLLGNYTSNIFVEQTSYMSIGSSGGTSHQKPEKVDGVSPFEVGIAQIPQVNPAKPKAISQGPSIVIFKEGKKITEQQVYASWLFVKFLTTSAAFQADFSRVSGYFPVIKSVNTDPVYTSYLEKADGFDYLQALAVKVGVELADSYYTSPAFVGSSDARDEVGRLFVKCLTITQNVDSGIESAFEEAITECEYRFE
ncbi:MAG: extracellular solute-binding protein [Clostridia bacterium]|nr:extracellular solute-binding protein [Clostridia bacterium]